MSEKWRCPQCKAVNQKPDYILRLATLSQSLGRVSLGTTNQPPPRCSQCQFEVDINAMLMGEYDHAEPAIPDQPIRSEINESVPETSAAPRRQGRVGKKVFIGAGIGLLVLVIAVILIGGKYLDRVNGPTISSPGATPSLTAFPSVRILGESESLIVCQKRKDGIWTLAGKATDKLQITEDMVKYTIHLVDGSEPLIWSVEWCATTESILAGNMEHISYTFILNGIGIPLDLFQEHDDFDDEILGYCHHYTTILMDWTPGEYLIKTITKYEQAINDGWGEYPARTRTTEYHITVTE